MKKFEKKWMKTMLICGASGLVLLGGTSAYLTDYAQAVNEFTVGKVEIELDEPDWNPKDHTEVTPNDEMKKNPKVTNTGINDAYVYLQVGIPKADVITADAQGNREGQAVRELFTFTANRGWTLIDTKENEKEKLYTYAYDQVLKAKQATGTLFDKVKFINVVEGQLDTKVLNIPIKAYAIQTAHTGGESGDVPNQAKTAFQKYVNQNVGQDGKVME